MSKNIRIVLEYLCLPSLSANQQIQRIDNALLEIKCIIEEAKPTSRVYTEDEVEMYNGSLHAKPKVQSWTPQQALDQYQSNLLKALGVDRDE